MGSRRWDHIGDLLSEQGDTAGAKAADQQAADSGHHTVSPRGAVHLGDLLRKQGDTAGAKAAYQQAADSGHEYWVLLAAVSRLRDA